MDYNIWWVEQVGGLQSIEGALDLREEGGKR